MSDIVDFIPVIVNTALAGPAANDPVLLHVELSHVEFKAGFVFGEKQ